MIDSNILKIAGALIAGIAGIIGILWQTRTADNKLTRYGKWLFGMAIVEVVIAAFDAADGAADSLGCEDHLHRNG